MKKNPENRRPYPDCIRQKNIHLIPLPFNRLFKWQYPKECSKNFHTATYIINSEFGSIYSWAWSDHRQFHQSSFPTKAQFLKTINQNKVNYYAIQQYNSINNYECIPCCSNKSLAWRCSYAISVFTNVAVHYHRLVIEAVRWESKSL